MAKKKKRDNVTLACNDCKMRNYITSKNRQNQPGRVEFIKFCPRCNKRTMHKESK